MKKRPFSVSLPLLFIYYFTALLQIKVYFWTDPFVLYYNHLMASKTVIKGLIVLVGLLIYNAYGIEGEIPLQSCQKLASQSFSPPVFQQYSKTIDVASLKGRTLYTMFAPHLHEYVREDILRILGQRENDSKVLNDLEELLKKHSSTIDTQKALFQELLSLARKQSIRWIGIENFLSSEEKIPVQVMRNQLKKRFSSHLGWDAEKQERLIYLLYNADIIAYHDHPVLFAQAQRIDLGDDSLESVTGRLVEPVLDLMQILRFMQRDGWASKAHAFHQLNVDALDIPIPDSLKQTILSQVKQEGEEGMDEVVRSYIDFRNKFAVFNELRNKAFARNILNQKGLGIAILGTNHKTSVQKHIKELNEQELSQ